MLPSGAPVPVACTPDFIVADAALSTFRLLTGKKLQAEGGEPVASP